MVRKSKTRRNIPRSGKDAGGGGGNGGGGNGGGGNGGGGNGGGGKRGIPVKGREKGDIARDMVRQSDDPEVPRKPGSSRIDKTISAANTPKSEDDQSKNRESIKMAIQHAKPGEVVDIRPLGDQLPASRTTALIKTDAMEVIRLVLPIHKEMQPHRVDGEITVQCLEGKVQFSAGDSQCELTAGHFLVTVHGIM